MNRRRVPIALRNLLHSRRRLVAALAGVIFAVVLVNIEIGILAGFISNSSGFIDRMPADVWVTGKGTKNFDQPFAIPETVLHRVRSVPEVAWAEDLFVSWSHWKLKSGTQEVVEIIGLPERGSLPIPWEVNPPEARDLREPYGVIIDEAEAARLEVTGIGQTSELMGTRVKVIGFTKGLRSFTTAPYVITRMNHALGMTQLNIGGLGYVLVKARDGVSGRALAAKLKERLPGYDVMTGTQFRNRTWGYWLFGTGVGSGFFISALLGFIVGGAVVGQVLYAMVMEQRPEFGVLKAMGSENTRLRNMVATQAMIIGITGYVLGMLATIPLQMMIVSVGTPFKLFWQLVAGGFLMTVGVCAAATVVPVLKIYALEPAMVFRGEGLSGGSKRARRTSGRRTAGKSGSPEAGPALSLHGICRGFAYAGGRAEVLKGTDLRVERGELVIVAGPSGSGKSTLLCVMGGLLEADRGSIRVFGRDLMEMDEDGIQRVRRSDIGFVFQNIYLMPALTALENVRIASDIKGSGRRSEEELLGYVGMAGMARKRPAELSGGEKQRVAIARALAGDPQVILADEPTASLDTENAYDVMDLLSRLARNDSRAVVVVTHDVRLFGYADRMYELEGGLTKEVEAYDEEYVSVFNGIGSDASLGLSGWGGEGDLVCVGEDRAGG